MIESLVGVVQEERNGLGSDVAGITVRPQALCHMIYVADDK